MATRKVLQTYQRCIFGLLFQLLALSHPFLFLLKQRSQTFLPFLIIRLFFSHAYDFFSDFKSIFSNLKQCASVYLCFSRYFRIVKIYTALYDSSNLFEHSSKISLKLRRQVLKNFLQIFWILIIYFNL